MLHLISNPGFQPPASHIDITGIALIAGVIACVVVILIAAMPAIKDRDPGYLFVGVIVGFFIAAFAAAIAASVTASIASDEASHLRASWEDRVVTYLHDGYGIRVTRDDVDSLTDSKPDPLVVTYNGHPTSIKLARGADGSLAIVNSGNQPLNPIGE